jgi:hypothetical protein
MKAKWEEVRTFQGHDDGTGLDVRYTNWGEPFREGIRLELRCGGRIGCVDLELQEAKNLHAVLGSLLRRMQRASSRSEGSDSTSQRTGARQ